MPMTLNDPLVILVKTILFIDGVYMCVASRPRTDFVQLLISPCRWDWLMDLPYEYRLLTRKELRRWPVLVS